MSIALSIALLVLCGVFFFFAAGNARQATSQDKKKERLGLLVPGCGFLCYALALLLKPGVLISGALLILGVILQTVGRAIYEWLVFPAVRTSKNHAPRPESKRTHHEN